MNLEAWKILMEGSTPDGVDNHSVAPEYGNGSAIEQETSIFLYGLVRRLHPAIIFETGTNWGYSSACLALGLVDAAKDYPNQLGHLYTVDSSGYDGKPEALWEKIGVNRVITHYVENSWSCKPIAPWADLIFFDADHSAEEIIKEFINWFPYMNVNGCWTAWHDTRLDKRAAPGIQAILDMKDLWETKYNTVQRVHMRNFRGLDLAQFRND